MTLYVTFFWRQLLGRPMAMKRVWFLAVMLLLISCASAQKLDVLLIGQVTPEHCPAPNWFSYEPLVDFSLVPTKLYFQMTYEDAQRQIRVYFPRTREDLGEYEFFYFINPYFEPFIPTQIENLRSAIVEGGSGGFQTLGGITIDWTEVNWPWVNSVLASAFPNDPLAYEVWERQKEGNLPYKVKVDKDSGLPPVLGMFVPLGIETVPGYWTIVLIIPQPGSTVWARAEGAYPKAPEVPPAWLISWGYGKGMTWSVADDFDTPWWADTYYPSEQEYGLDILMNIMLHSLGRRLPEDIVMVNAARRSFEDYAAKSSTITTFFDFVEKFGVSSSKLVNEKASIDQVIKQAMASYIEGYYDEALEYADEAHGLIGELQARTMKLKDQALLWVYVTEWAAVSGTSMISGYILYALLIRRRLYREVSVTRLS